MPTKSPPGNSALRRGPLLLLFIAAMLAGLAVITWKPQWENGLFPVSVDGRMGYIDREGRTVIAPRFDLAHDFSEGLAKIQWNQKWGYIDRKGNPAIAPQFGFAKDFSEGLAAVQLGAKWGYIDKKGDFVIEPEFRYGGSFSSGRAPVQLNDKWGYVKRDGKFVVRPQFSNANDFSEGLASVRLGGTHGGVDKQRLATLGYDGFFKAKQELKYGYINPRGEWVVAPRFDWGGPFSEGLAQVKLGDRSGYVNKTGKRVIPPRFEWAYGPFSEGFASVKVDDKYGYIDRSGKFVIAPLYEDAGPFSEGLAAVKVGGRWGYADRSGKLIIAPMYEDAEAFSRGLARFKMGDEVGYLDRTGKRVWTAEKPRGAARGHSPALYPVSLDGKMGYVDGTGKLAIDPQFDLAYSFSEGLAKVKMGQLWGFIDKNGKLVIPLQFQWAGKFSEGLAHVKLADRYGYIDKSGRFIIAPQFMGAGRFFDGLAPVRLGGQWGYIDERGKIVIQPRYDEAHTFSEGLANVRLRGQYGYIDRTGRMVIRPQFQWAGSFSEGLADVLKEGVYGYINKKKKFMIAPQFEWAGRFMEGLAPVKVGDRWGYIDRFGTFAIPPQFEWTYGFSNGLAIVEIGGKYGFINPAGRRVIPPEFDQPFIGLFTDGLSMTMTDKEALCYTDRAGRPIWCDPAGRRNGALLASLSGRTGSLGTLPPVSAPGGLTPAGPHTGVPKTPRFYRKSWGIVIGINHYDSWPSLEYAVNDALAVERMLKRLGFDEVVRILDREATRERILNLLATELPQKVGAEDRVVIFFAGHGQTETLAGGGEQGYIIPVDADNRNYFTKAISMTQVRELSQRIPAKHLLYVMDSCYSGYGLMRGSGLNPGVEGYVEKITSMRSVQMITAGGKNEQVRESHGHGLFTEYLLQGLEGDGDLDGDGVVTASELGSFLKAQVSLASEHQQTPQQGRLDGEGEVVFITPKTMDGSWAAREHAD